MKKTKYENRTIPTIINIIFFTIFPILFLSGFIVVYRVPVTETGILQSNGIKILILCVLGFLFCFTIFGIIGEIFGKLKGQNFINHELKAIKKDNPYLYFRELPNNFGIGVTSLLFDSTLENNKDIIAIILDLCAKKYLSLVKVNDKYILKVLDLDDQDLLSNEKYVLNLIKTGKIKEIDYHEWYNYCLEDGTKLGLYAYQDNLVIINNNDGLFPIRTLKKLKRTHLIISLLIGSLGAIVFLLNGKVSEALVSGLVLGLASFIVLLVPFFITFLIIGIINSSKMAQKKSYQIALNNHLVRTDKGINELQKLFLFKNFLADFGNFVSRNPEEVVLWDRYLSYAQVFGLTKEIMKTGYRNLVDNASFQIDDIDNITIDKLEIGN